MNKKFFLLPLVLLIFAVTPQAFAEYEDTIVVLETDSGRLIIEFFPQFAPNHVENFVTLAEDGFYTETIFHRIIEGFMIQGGDPKSADPSYSMSEWGTGDPGYSIDAEFNDIKHDRGIVSMARSNDPNSAGSQFFIVHEDSNFLDGAYTVFGRIITQDSYDTLDTIAELETMPNDQAVDTFKAIIEKAYVKDRSEIKDVLDLAPPQRTGGTEETSSTETLTSSEERYTNNFLGISFDAPVGWLIQSPTKVDHLTPDVVVLGPQTSFSSPAISISVLGNSGTLDNEIEKLKQRIKPLIEQNVLTIQDEGSSSVDNTPAYVLRATGNFENANDQLREIGFATILVVDENRLYTIQYTNHLSDYENHTEKVSDFLDSFQIIHSGPDSTTYAEGDTRADSSAEQSEGGGCLIATAAFGSEMAPQVQFLREIRDNTVMSTQSGTAFMTGFNQFYYSFSPAVADYERENPVFKEAVKVTLTPLLTSLTLLNYVDVDSEQEMLGYGIGIILLNIGMYFVAPAATIIAIKNRIKRN